MSEEKRVSIYDYKPEHFGDTILEGVIVGDVQTYVIYSGFVPSGVMWRWLYPQLVNDGVPEFFGPWNYERQCAQGVPPPTRAEVMDDIAALTRALLAEGALRTDAFEAA